MNVLNQDLRPAVFNYEVMRGSTLEPGTFVIRAAGVPLDLTGCLIYAQMRGRGGAFSFTIYRDDLAGRITPVMPPSITRNIPPGAYDWDLEVWDTLGKEKKYARGTIRVTDEATRV